MAPTTSTHGAQANPDATWVNVIEGSEVHREREPTRLLRVSGRAPPGDLGVTSYWLGGLAYTAIALAAGEWLTVDWTMIDNEEPFDEIEAGERQLDRGPAPHPGGPGAGRASAAPGDADTARARGDGHARRAHRGRPARPGRVRRARAGTARAAVGAAREEGTIGSGAAHRVRSGGNGVAGLAWADRTAGGDSAVGPGEQRESHHRAHDAPAERTAERDRLRPLHAGNGRA